MMDWDEGYNWSYEDYRKVVNKYVSAGERVVSLDVEHCSAQNEYEIIDWAKKDGYNAVKKNEVIAIYLKTDDVVRLSDIKNDITKLIEEYGNMEVFSIGAYMSGERTHDYYFKTEKGDLKFWENVEEKKRSISKATKKVKIAIVCDNCLETNDKFLQWVEDLQEAISETVDCSYAYKRILTPSVIIDFMTGEPNESEEYLKVYESTVTVDEVLKLIRGE